MLSKITLIFIMLNSRLLFANPDDTKSTVKLETEKTEVRAQEVSWTDTRSTRSSARTLASAAGLGLVGAAGAVFAAASLPAIALTAGTAALAGGAYRFYSRAHRTASQFTMDQNGALTESLRLSPNLFSQDRKLKNGFDLLRAHVFLEDELIQTTGETYAYVFESLKEKLRNKLADHEAFINALDSKVLDQQIGLVLETNGQLYTGGAVYESIFHALPVLGFSRKGAVDYRTYVDQDPATAIVPANSAQTDYKPTHKLTITRDIRNNVFIVLEVERSAGLRLVTSIPKLPYELDVTMIMTFPIKHEVPAGAPLIMPTAKVSYKLRALDI